MFYDYCQEKNIQNLSASIGVYLLDSHAERAQKTCYGRLTAMGAMAASAMQLVGILLLYGQYAGVQVCFLQES